MTPTLPRQGESVASPSAGILGARPRPILLVEKSYSRAGELLGAIQRLGVPCVVALDINMFERWRESVKPRVVVLNLEVEWTHEIGNLLIDEGVDVVAVSDDHKERLAAIERGYSEVLAGNLSIDEIAAISARLGSRIHHSDADDAPPSEQISSGPLIVDVARRIVYWIGEEVDLPPKEFAVAAYLAARPGVHVPIPTLLREIWREGWGSPGKVHTTVSPLRRALGQGSSLVIRVKHGHAVYEPASLSRDKETKSLHEATKTPRRHSSDP